MFFLSVHIRKIFCVVGKGKVSKKEEQKKSKMEMKEDIQVKIADLGNSCWIVSIKYL